MNRFEMRERLENKLTKKRFEHSLGVEYVSGCLAMVHGADVIITQEKNTELTMRTSDRL